jgi:hypothetical protein
VGEKRFKPVNLRGERQFGRSRIRWEDYIKNNLTEIECEIVCWIHLSNVKMAVKLWVFIKGGKFLVGKISIYTNGGKILEWFLSADFIEELCSMALIS